MHRAQSVRFFAALAAAILFIQFPRAGTALQAPRGTAAQAPAAGSLTVSGQVINTIPPAAMASPRGARAGAAAGAVAATLYLMQRDANGTAVRTVQQSVRPNMDPPASGRFEIPNVAPGSYELFASLPDATGWGPSAAPGQASQPLGFGRTVFEARGNVTDVQVNIHQGVDMKGRVTVDGKPGAPAGLQIFVQPDSAAMLILPYSFISRFQPMIGTDGTFTFPALPEAEYAIRVGMNPPSSIALADILVDGKSFKSGGVRIGATPPGPMEIRLTNGGGPALSSITPPARGGAAATAQGARGPRATAAAPAPNARGGVPATAAQPPRPLVLASTGRPAVLQTRLESLPSGAAGPAKDCGHAGKEAPQTVVQCVEQAIVRKENFIASFPQAGIDCWTLYPSIPNERPYLQCKF